MLCLFQSGGLSHVDLFDYKPTLTKHHGKEIPPSVKGTQRLTGMTSRPGQVSRRRAAARRADACGQHGTWISDLLPHMQTIADELCIVKSMHTEAINHDPAITYMNTGNQQPGYASMGAWVSYGLGSENENLPAFIAMVSQGSGKNPGQPIFSRLWGNGFLPSSHQGVGLRPGRESGAVSGQSAGHRPRAAAGAARRPGGAESAASRASWAIPKRWPASALTKWRSACRPPCPS